MTGTKTKTNMPTFKRVEGKENLFTDEHGNHYEINGGEFTPVNNPDESKDAELSFEERLALMDKKVETGEISCNLDNPEDCEACGS